MSFCKTGKGIFFSAHEVERLFPFLLSQNKQFKCCTIWTFTYLTLNRTGHGAKQATTIDRNANRISYTIIIDLLVSWSNLHNEKIKEFTQLLCCVSDSLLRKFQKTAERSQSAACPSSKPKDRADRLFSSHPDNSLFFSLRSSAALVSEFTHIISVSIFSLISLRYPIGTEEWENQCFKKHDREMSCSFSLSKHHGVQRKYRRT